MPLRKRIISPKPLKFPRLAKHLLYWAGAFVFYAVYFGFRGDVYGESTLFIMLLLPITALTSYGLIYWLIPQYLFKRRYLQFALYLCYAILLSLYLELSLMMLLYLYNGDIQAIFTRPSVFDLMDLVIGMYVVVFGAVSLNLWGRWMATHSLSIRHQIHRQAAESRLEEIQSQEPQFLTLRSDRKEIRIPTDEIAYIESVKDYVLVHSTSGQTMSKRTMSSIESELTDAGFIRIHRSYLIRRDAVRAFSAQEVDLGTIKLPISRTYRDAVRNELQPS